MSRITKDIAASVAKQLVQPRVEEKEKIQSELREHLRAYYLTTVPEDVLIEYHKNPAYFHVTNSIRILGEGLEDRYTYYSIGEQLPQNNNNERVSLPPKVAHKVVKLVDLLSDKKQEINKLQNEIESALYNLRTYSNVEKEFPEAFKLLPPTPVITALAINIKDIRCKLDKANC